MKKRINLIFFIIILLLGIGLRAQETISHNFLFLLDQGRDMTAVKGIIYDNHLTLIGPSTSLRGVFQGPLWYYLLAIPTIILAGNPWGTVVLMFMISVGVLIVAYLWTKNIFGEKAAIFTLFLFAISPEAVAAATYTWNPHPMWLLVTLFMFSFFELVGRGKKKFHLVVWPLVGLMFHFQTALAVFILVGSLVYLFFFKRKSIIQKQFIFGILISSIFFIPQIAFEFRHDFLMTKSVLNIFLGQDQGLFVGGESRSYFDLIGRNISVFYYNFGTSFVRDGYLKDSPKLALMAIVVCLVFRKKLSIFTKKEWDFVCIILGLVSIIAILSFIYPFPLRYWFLTGVQSFYLIPFGVLLGKLWNARIGKIAIISLFVIFTFYSLQKINSLYFHPPNDGGKEKIKGKLSAIDYVYSDAKGKDFGLLIFTPAVYTDAYDYLIWWHGKRKYNYIPYLAKKGTFYLLMEKDTSKPWSYKGWLETVIKTGNVLKETTLPVGLIIQKRSI
ncbi:MAG: glycosyltransferase family 39 protein [Candidatus Levybacteria bacterium]|nr:glycosyltransferase family 39 protein [Candidatus Levybacteria bacterium]